MPNSEKTNVTLTVSADVAATLDRIAAALGQDRAGVIVRAIDQYLAGEGAEIIDDLEGLAEVERGESYDLDEVLAEAYAVIEAAERRQRRAANANGPAFETRQTLVIPKKRRIVRR